MLAGWWIVAASLMVTFHSSLQHETLHGHPTRSARLNELLVFPAIGLFVPYRSFRETHLRHHNDANLTDPYDDPESWYLPLAQWNRTGSFRRRLLNANNTLLGRMIFGPALGLAGFWRNEWRRIVAGDRAVRGAWLAHLLGLVPVLALVHVCAVPPWLYVVAAYGGMSVLMVRTFIEHRAADAMPHRTAVVEAGLLMRLLFLNNNYHAVHHNHPAMAWYRLPELWRAERAQTLERNGYYHYSGGYAQVVRSWLFCQRQPVAHPLLCRGPVTPADTDPASPPPSPISQPLTSVIAPETR